MSNDIDMAHRVPMTAYRGEVIRLVRDLPEDLHRLSTGATSSAEVLLGMLYPDREYAQHAQHLPHILRSSFRLPPLPFASRFGTRAQEGISYAAESIETALHEAVYYGYLHRLMSGQLEPNTIERRAIRLRLRSPHAVDLSGPDWAAYCSLLRHPTDHAWTQRLGAALRQRGATILRYPSARDPGAGACLAVLDGRAYAATLHDDGLWSIRLDTERADCLRRSPGSDQRLHIAYASYLVDGKTFPLLTPGR
jgi:hypothetical protein